MSAGNHAQGVALAAKLLDVDATVVMPAEAPETKVAATEGYGASVIQQGHGYEELRQRADQLIDDHGYTLVHPFADPEVIAGQGTLGLELIEEVPRLDLVIVPIGGGGLASGVATALAGSANAPRIVAVETVGTAHAGRAIEQGEVVVREEIDTIAEGIAAGRTEPYTLAHLRERVDQVVSVSDEAAIEALTLLAERANTVAEPAGALPVAALLSGAVDVTGERVVAVISGGNVDLGDFCAYIRAARRSPDADG